MKEGWVYKKLGEIATTINGLWKGKKEPFVNVGVIRNANFTKDITLDFSKIEYLNVEERQYQKRKLQKGDLIVEKSGGSEKQPVGRTVLFNAEGEFSVSNFTSILRINNQNEITPEFLYKYLLYIYREGRTKEMQNAATGIHNIIFEKFLAISTPIPSLSEQQRIVSYLDAEFAKIEALKANAEKQLQAAKDLFQAALKEMLTPKEGWVEKKLGEIADIKGGKRVPKGYKFETTKTAHIYIRVADFSNEGTISLDDLQYISDDVYEQIKRYTITSDDVYISIAGTIGKSGIIPKELNGANLTENACKLVLKGDVCKEFIYCTTLSSDFKTKIEKMTKVGAQPKLALTRLAQVDISFPHNVSEQQQVAAQLDNLSAKVKQLQNNYEQTITLCNDLKQSLLKKIFE